MNDKDKWVNDTLTSMEGSQRATPPPSLLTKIEHKLDAVTARVIPISHLRLAAAAAILLIITNGFLLLQNVNSQKSELGEMVEQQDNQSLISNYQLYEEWTN